MAKLSPKLLFIYPRIDRPGTLRPFLCLSGQVGPLTLCCLFSQPFCPRQCTPQRERPIDVTVDIAPFYYADVKREYRMCDQTRYLHKKESMRVCRRVIDIHRAGVKG